MNNNLTNKTDNNLAKNFQFKPYLIDRLNLSAFDNIGITNEGKTIIFGKDSLIHSLSTKDKVINLVTSLSIKPDNKTFISSNNNETIKIWDMESGECINTLRGHTSSVNSIAVTPDGSTIISGSSDKTIKIWDIKSGKGINTLNGYTDWIDTVVVTPDIKTIIIVKNKDETINLLDIKNGKCIKTLKGHTSWVYSVIVTPDGNTIISRSLDKTIKIWDIKSGECIKTLEESAGSITVTPDGNAIVLGLSRWDDNIQLWDIKSGKCINTFEGHNGYSVNSIAVTPDGNTIISGSDDKTIKLWDIKSGECIKTLKGHNGSLYTLAVFSDGSTIISGSFDETIKLWDIKSGECIYTIYNMEDGTSITMQKDGYFNANDENINNFIRIDDISKSCRKLTKEEVEHFCKVKYENNSLDNDSISNIQNNCRDTIPSQKSKIEMIKDNIGVFFILWGIIIFLNQFLLFHACFNPACIVAALPHTGVITLVLLPFLLKNGKVQKQEHSYEAQHPAKNEKIDPLKEMGDDYEKNIGKLFESKGDFVIYNGLIRGFADGGVDLIVISPNSQSINFVQCKNWQNKNMEYQHICDVYDKLANYASNINISGVLSLYYLKHSKEIQKNLSYKKEYNEIANIFKSAYKYSNIRKTLYISTDKVLDPDINQYIKMIKPNIFRYKDMKIVISKI